LIEHFRDPDRRKEFFKEYKEIEMLYEIISPDAFLRPFIETYATLSAIYAVVSKAYLKTVYVDRAFQRKTNELVRSHVGIDRVGKVAELVKLDEKTIDLIQRQKGGDSTKVINLVKSIEKAAEDSSDDPFLVALSECAAAVQAAFEDRQKSTAEALDDLLKEVERNERRKKEQAATGLDTVGYFVLGKLTEDGIKNARETRQREGDRHRPAASRLLRGA
jgi:type I restriction enzyme, R subunit